MDLIGRRALITGASERIGARIAVRIARQGADIILHHRNSAAAAELTAKEIRDTGRQVMISSCDFSMPSKVEKWYCLLEKEFGSIDFLINSASDYTENTYETLSLEELNRSMSIHVLSPLILIRTMAQKKNEKRKGVVNILDTRVFSHDPLHAAYHMGKQGLHTLTRELAVELAPEMRINAVAPGIILPPKGRDKEWLKRLESSNVLNSHGHPDDIADAVLYLLGAQFVTGQVLFVDGGRHLAR